MEQDLPARKRLRLKKYDYSQPGCYFVTMCTKVRRENILCRIGAPVGAAALGGPSSINLGTIAGPSLVNLGTLGGPSPVNLGTIAGAPHMELTPSGEIVKGLIEKIDLVYSNAHVDTYVIMPDHVHMVLKLDGPPRAAAPTGAAQEHMQVCGIPQIINALKGLSSKEIGESIWQRGYYDHIIRNDTELKEIRLYVQNNPLKWIFR